MSKVSVKKNIFFQICYEFLVLALPFITSPYIARVMGVDGVGIYSYTHSIAFYFVLFSMLGIKNYASRSIARIRDNQQALNKLFSELFVLHVLITGVGMIVYLLYVSLYSKYTTIALIQAFLILGAAIDISWLYIGLERFKITVTSNTIIKIATVFSVFLFVKDREDLECYTFILAFGTFLSHAVMWIPLRKYVKFVSVKLSDISIHVKPQLLLFIPTIAVSLYKYMDKIMLGSFGSVEELGYFANAESVSTVPIAIIAAFGVVMMPRVSHLLGNNRKEQALEYICLSMKYVMWVAFGMAFGLAAVGKLFAYCFWGAKFIPSGSLIVWLSITVPFLAFANVLRTQYLIPNNMDKIYIGSVVLGAIVNIVLNLLLIPKFGALGTTISTIFAEITVCLYQTYYVRNILNISTYFNQCIPFFVIGGIMYMGINYSGNFLGNNYLSLLVEIGIGIIVYLSLSILYFIKTKDQIIQKLIG